MNKFTRIATNIQSTKEIAEYIYYETLASFLEKQKKLWIEQYFKIPFGNRSKFGLIKFIKEAINKFNNIEDIEQNFKNENNLYIFLAKITLDKMTCEKELNSKYSNVIENANINFYFKYDIEATNASVSIKENLNFNLTLNYNNLLNKIILNKENEIINVISHELQHVLYYKYRLKKYENDPIKYNQKREQLMQPIINVKNIDEYYNQPPEITAYVNEIVNDIEEALTHKIDMYVPSGYKEFIEFLYNNSYSFEKFAKSFDKSKSNKRLVDFMLTPKNKKLFLQLIYNTLEKRGIWDILK